MLRSFRRWITRHATGAAAHAAPHLSGTAIDRGTALVGRCAAYLPVVSQNVAANMRALGVYTPEAFHGYFRQLGRHFAGAMHALRHADRTPPGTIHPQVARLACERVELDRSMEKLLAAAAERQGVILVGPHVSNYLLFLARLNMEVPLTVYLRHSRDARRTELKQRWYRASGLEWIAEPRDEAGPLGRLGRMAAALGEGRVLYITPDLPRKRHDGTPVQFFEREIYLPAGPAMLAVRTWAPLFALVAEAVGDRQRLIAHGPYEPPPLGRGRDARRTAIRQHLQWFAARFEEFLVHQPAMWYLWGDKRWTRLLRGDRRYVRRLSDDEPDSTEESDATSGVAEAG